MALVLTRKDGEGIRIGRAVVYVSRLGGRTKVVVDAPRDVDVVRLEIQGRETHEADQDEAPAAVLP